MGQETNMYTVHVGYRVSSQKFSLGWTPLLNTSNRCMSYNYSKIGAYNNCICLVYTIIVTFHTINLKYWIDHVNIYLVIFVGDFNACISVWHVLLFIE